MRRFYSQLQILIRLHIQTRGVAQLLTVVVKALFKGKVSSLYNLFIRHQTIVFVMILILPLIIYIEENYGDEDGFCRDVRARLAELHEENLRELAEVQDVLL